MFVLVFMMHYQSVIRVITGKWLLCILYIAEYEEKGLLETDEVRNYAQHKFFNNRICFGKIVLLNVLSRPHLTRVKWLI